MSTSFFATDPPEALAAEANYDESKIPAYTLPDLLTTTAGEKVDSVEKWEKVRRPEILELFREHMFGRAPGRPEGMTFEAEPVKKISAYQTRRVVRVKFGPESDAPSMRITILMPGSDEPRPVFVGMNLFDPEKLPPQLGAAWSAPQGYEALGAHDNAYSAMMESGFCVATISPVDFAPDDKATYDQGVISYFREKSGAADSGNEWKAIGAWAWALSRAMDYFETDPLIDPKRVIVIGHSRMGKTALWAGAQDPRFAAVISNESGCGGAALSRRAIGETVKMINDRFPHWFCDNFKKYNDRESDLPLDQHMLIALTAPRPVYIASAEEDKWADPKGEFLAAVAAEPVWRLYGLDGLGQSEQPRVNEPIGDRIAYHIRSGKHALSAYDWLHYLDFAERVVGRYPGANDREEAALNKSKGRVRRSGLKLIITPDQGEPKIFERIPYWASAEGVRNPVLAGAYENPDMLYVEVHCYEWGESYLIDAVTGTETKVDDAPVFSPDRKRFATKVFDLMNGPCRVQIWRVAYPAPVLEWTYDNSVYGEGDVHFLSWKSPTELIFDDDVGSGDSRRKVTVTATYKNGEWKCEPCERRPPSDE